MSKSQNNNTSNLREVGGGRGDEGEKPKGLN